MRLEPVRALTPFAVALGVGFDAILEVDFLYEHGISVSLAQHCLVFEAHDGLIVPLVGHPPRFKHACALTHDVALYPGGGPIGAVCLRTLGEKGWDSASTRGVLGGSAEGPGIGISGA